uniref:Uncharacterized protein n=1 Tax=Rhizophora mucronata TaxID=61149 RepID=A0A2P2P4N7_RHIMU
MAVLTAKDWSNFIAFKDGQDHLSSTVTPLHQTFSFIKQQVPHMDIT